MKFSLRPRGEEIHLEGKDSVVQVLTLREMTAADRDSYLVAISNRISVGPDGKPSPVLKDVAGFQAELLSRCLERMDGSRVEIQEIQSWPSSVVQALFDRAQELNKLSNVPESKNP